MTHAAPLPERPRRRVEAGRRRRELEWLEAQRRAFHHPAFVAPDPLEFVLPAAGSRDREIAAIVAALLAYGNVIAMRPAIDRVLRRIRGDAATPIPPRDPRAAWPVPAVEGLADALAARTDHDLDDAFADLRYRVTPGRTIAGLLAAVRRVQAAHGDLESAFVAHDDPAATTVLSGLAGLVDELQSASPVPLDHLLPDPRRGSACKRPCLMLRWLVRRDEIDPGGWSRVDPARLVMPLDTHVQQAARRRRWTRRRTVGLATALDVTALLAVLAPEDPLRWDFAITRPGIRGPQPGSDARDGDAEPRPRARGRGPGEP